MTTNIKAKQLKLLLNDFELMSKTALTQFQIAAKLLQDNTISSLYEEAESNEIIMDRLEVKIREEVVFAIFQFTPKAADLRQIITYQDTTHNLERVGDMLLNIIHYTKQTDLNIHHFEEEKKLITKMLKYTGEMLHNAIFSFSNEDSLTAYKVIEEDDKVDALFHQINTTLQDTFVNKSLAKEEIKNIININAISQNLERIGDSATNIAEAAIYLTDGKDIRHGNKE
jgi:phosphate transport system protein